MHPSYFLANSYSAFTPILNTASVVCSINDRITDCSLLSAFGFIGLAFGAFFAVIGIAFAVLMIVSMWKVYEKAGHPGWAAIVPVYNIVVLLQIIRKPLWWIALYFVPIVNIVIALIAQYELAKSFGKDMAFTAGMVFLPFIFYPILAFGDAKYTAPNRPTTV